MWPILLHKILGILLVFPLFLVREFFLFFLIFVRFLIYGTSVSTFTEKDSIARRTVVVERVDVTDFWVRPTRQDLLVLWEVVIGDILQNYCSHSSRNPCAENQCMCGVYSSDFKKIQEYSLFYYRKNRRLTYARPLFDLTIVTSVFLVSVLSAIVKRFIPHRW